jgi:hypothetical protein
VWFHDELGWESLPLLRGKSGMSADGWYQRGTHTLGCENFVGHWAKICESRRISSPCFFPDTRGDDWFTTKASTGWRRRYPCTPYPTPLGTGKPPSNDQSGSMGKPHLTRVGATRRPRRTPRDIKHTPPFGGDTSANRHHHYPEVIMIFPLGRRENVHEARQKKTRGCRVTRIHNRLVLIM